MYNYLIVFLILYNCDKSVAVRKYTKEDILKLREEVRDMFQHAYDSYLQHAFPYDELRPLSCDGVDTWGSYSLTLIDALDTLAIMGNYTEFNRVVNIVLQKQNFDADINVSVFETNIRIVGGLLSAHLLSHKTGMELEPGWPCNGPLLRLAEDVAQRLIAAFDTTTGMPYGTINLRSGVPPGETSITCTAGVGTFIVEFGTLSRLTGDPLYEEVALNALMALYNHRSPIGLLGNHIDVMSGRWTAQDAGIGGGVDSYYEYLVKGAILLERPELMAMFHEARAALERYVRKEDWYVWASMGRGQVTLPVFQSLDAYWPGVLAMAGDVDTALRVLHSQHSVWRQYGFTPEAYHLGAGEAAAGREGYPLRPELVESLMVLLRHSRDPALLPMAEDVLRSLQHSARTGCGYATIKDVRDHRKEDRMESFFLAETTKYLYLIFDPDNFIHNPGVSGKTIQTPKGECLIDFGGYIFNTEAHPIDPALLACCHEHNQGVNISEVHRIYQILEEEDNVQFMTMIEASTADNATDASVNHTEVPTEVTAANVTEPQLKSDDNDSNQAIIKTETKTGYVNLDGSEREKVVNESTLSDIVKERIIKYYNSTHAKTESNVEDKLETVEEATVEVDDIIVPHKAIDSEKLQLPSSSKAKEAFKMLPTVLQEFLNREWKTKPKCEPQHMLERIRKEKKYSPHPDENKYELLLTPAPSFLQRISLAGEFLNKKQLEL